MALTAAEIFKVSHIQLQNENILIMYGTEPFISIRHPGLCVCYCSLNFSVDGILGQQKQNRYSFQK